MYRYSVLIELFPWPVMMTSRCCSACDVVAWDDFSDVGRGCEEGGADWEAVRHHTAGSRGRRALVWAPAKYFDCLHNELMISKSDRFFRCHLNCACQCSCYEKVDGIALLMSAACGQPHLYRTTSVFLTRMNPLLSMYMYIRSGAVDVCIALFAVPGWPHSHSQRERHEAGSRAVPGGRAGGRQHDRHRLARRGQAAAHADGQRQWLHRASRALPGARLYLLQAQAPPQGEAPWQAPEVTKPQRQVLKAVTSVMRRQHWLCFKSLSWLSHKRFKRGTLCSSCSVGGLRCTLITISGCSMSGFVWTCAARNTKLKPNTFSWCRERFRRKNARFLLVTCEWYYCYINLNRDSMPS